MTNMSQSSALKKLRPFLAQHKTYIDRVQFYLHSGCTQWALCLLVRSKEMLRYITEQLIELGLDVDSKEGSTVLVFIPLRKETELMRGLDASDKAMYIVVEMFEQEKREVVKELGLNDEATLYGQLGGFQ